METSHLDSLPITDIEPPRGWFRINFSELWEFRELLYFLVWRDIKVRYAQTVLGAAWVIIQPVVTMVIFSVIFGRLANLPSDGIPYPIFSYTALLPWQLFARGLTEASGSLVSNQAFVTKTYFPRLFLPTASVISGLVDFIIAMTVLFGMMLVYQVEFTTRLLVLPALILFTLLTSLAVALWLSPVNVRYRDVKYTLSYLVQVWMYATPVVYSSSLIPENLRLIYSLNPMVGVVEGFRWALLGQESYVFPMIAVSTVVVILMFIGGLLYFQRKESSFSDVI